MIEWFTPQEANMFGALAGGVLGGVGGGGTGALIGVCAPRGRLKRLVIGLQIGWVVCGLACLGAGLVALIVGQPAHVIQPFVLVGGILTAVMGGLLPVTLKTYRQAEMRRLAVEELRRG
ncbi:MAG: hypothetical protein JNM80_11830 [Phycisphaerae bacterium]|nr:hypothetical protein [Phycisphaerae bacterium]